MDRDIELIPGQLYKHFKGNLYQIVAVAYHSETQEKMVVYQALYGDFKVYVRPYDMFLSKVDREKYPEIAQEYRFERVYAKVQNSEPEERLMKAPLSYTEPEERLMKAPLSYTEPEDRLMKAPTSLLRDEASGNTNFTSEGGGVNPKLIKFLDTDSYNEKLKIYLDMHDTITEIEIEDIAASLDIAAGDGPLEEKYESVQYALHTLAKYERVNRND